MNTDLIIWIKIVVIFILLGFLFYLRTKRQGEKAKADAVKEEPVSMEADSMKGESSEEDRIE